MLRLGFESTAIGVAAVHICVTVAVCIVLTGQWQGKLPSQSDVYCTVWRWWMKMHNAGIQLEDTLYERGVFKLKLNFSLQDVSYLIATLFSCPHSLPIDHSQGPAKCCSVGDSPWWTHCLPAGLVSSWWELHGARVWSVCPSRLWTPKGDQQSLWH